MSGTLYTFPNNFRSNKILIAAEYSGQKVSVDPKFVAGETDKSAEFLKKFPFGKVPAYESGNVKLFEANAIAYYVGNAQTRGGDNEAEVLQWISFADSVIQPAACTWVYPTMGIMQYNKQSTEKAKSDIKSALAALNSHLSTRTFLVGERVTQADISIACTLTMLYEHVMEPAFRNAYGNVNRWFVTLVNQPQFKAVLGDVKLCEKMAQFDAKKYNEIHGKADKKSKGQKQASGAGDSQSKQKKETPKAAKPVQEEPKPPVKKDPWAGQPETTYDMDQFKRAYSNDKTPGHEESIKYFWDNFDKEKYSIWHATYNYNEDFVQGYMANNLVKGFHQRLGNMMKHTCSWSQIYERDTKPRFRLQSLWFWRLYEFVGGLPRDAFQSKLTSKELAFTLSENWQVDYESYTWRKIDPESDEAKKLVQYYFHPPEKDGEFTHKSEYVMK